MCQVQRGSPTAGQSSAPSASFLVLRLQFFDPYSSSAGVLTQYLVSPPTLHALLLFFSAAAPRDGQRTSDPPPCLSDELPPRTRRGHPLLWSFETKLLPSEATLVSNCVSPPSTLVLPPFLQELLFRQLLRQQLHILRRDPVVQIY